MTPKKARLLEEYLVDFNAAAAAVRAGYTPSSAKQRAQQILSQPLMQVALTTRLKQLRETIHITPEAVLQELAALAFADVSQLMSWDEAGEVALVPSAKLPRHITATVQSVKVRSRVTTGPDKATHRHTQIELTLHPKVKALELLGRYFEIFRQDEAFLDAFVELVLRYVGDPEGQQAIRAFLQQHTEPGAAPALRATYTAVESGPGQNGHRA
jgi:phage terminase small subunit